MIHAVILMLQLAGFSGLLLAFQRHQQEWLRRRLATNTARHLRLGGFLSLAVAYAPAGLVFGWGEGTVIWVGWLTIAAGLVVAINTNRERILSRVRQ
ncbi:DUF3325 domain-containing protein [Novosphingobium kaempferiae]|uniref:DUF3325 domain-containing protein n=1 Tax=Novosphingobium kaempferiae TaxID=2896849 RepID=UPI001E4F0088|nr:DUF3325 domain-containing protein [Novosphingobium kaempferiae]